MKKRTILFVETGNHGGGSFESLYLNILNLDRQRFEPIVFYLNETRYVEMLKAIGVEVHVVKDLLYNNVIPENLKRALVGINWTLGAVCPPLTALYEWLIHLRPIMAMRRLAAERGVDLIHLNNNMVRNYFCVVGLKGLGIPIVSYLRSFIVRGANPYMASYSNRNVACYIAYSEGVRDYWGKVGLETRKVSVVPNGIQMMEVEPANVWQKMGLKERKGPLIGCVGAVKVNRTYDFMIRSFARILQEEPEAFLVIVGKWMEKAVVQQLQALIADLGIGDSVRLHGFEPQAIRIIGGLDVLTIPYRVEPYGRILLEAWLARTPVVATRVGRIEEIIGSDRNGLLVSHGDETGMKDAVLRLWRDKALRQSMAEAGRRTVEERFSIQTCTRKLEDVYDRVLSDRRAGEMCQS